MATEARRLESLVRSIGATLTGDSSVVHELFSPDVRAWLPAPAPSPAALAVEIEDRSDAFADVEVGVLQSEIIDTYCWVEWYAAVTQVGQLEIAPTIFAPTGRRAVLHGFTVAEFDGDQIVTYHQSCDYSDLTRPEH